MRATSILSLFAGLLVPTMLTAQIQLPAPRGLPRTIGDATQRTGALLDHDLLDRLPARDAIDRLAEARTARLRSLVRDAPDHIEIDDAGNPAAKGRILLDHADPKLVERLLAEGFILIGEESVEGLDIAFVALTPPRNMSLARALRRVRKLAPDVDVSGDPLYQQSGFTPPIAAAPLAGAAGGTGLAIGLIDGGVGRSPTLSGPIEQRGFATGAPRASSHGTAVASLMVGRGAIAGVAPAAPLRVADVYGNDPAGGSATAIVRALGWLTLSGVRVITISLVGPPNPLLARAVAAAQQKDVRIVAAVGNDGPAAPPAFPASYVGVLAITAVDGRNRVLIEAGRSLHIDFAAPGADMLAARAEGGTITVRGTSFAAPLVAARLFRLGGNTDALAREAVDLGPKGPDKSYGRGLVCGECRTPAR